MKDSFPDAVLGGGVGGGQEARAVCCSIHSRLVTQGQREPMYPWCNMSPQYLYVYSGRTDCFTSPRGDGETALTQH